MSDLSSSLCVPPRPPGDPAGMIALAHSLQAQASTIADLGSHAQSRYRSSDFQGPAAGRDFVTCSGGLSLPIRSIDDERRMTDPAPRGRLRLAGPFAYYGPYILGGLLGIVANRFEWHQGLKLYLAAPLAVAGCIYFDRKRRARAKDAYSAQAELERRAADRLQSHDDFYPRN